MHMCGYVFLSQPFEARSNQWPSCSLNFSARMSREGFIQCPYCELWVPSALQLVHLSTHPGYMDALLGRSSASPAGAPLGRGMQTQSPGSAPQGIPGHSRQPRPSPEAQVPSSAAAVSGTAGLAAAGPNSAAGGLAPRAESHLVPSPPKVLAGFGALTGKSLSECLVWFKARGESGLLLDFLNANVVRPLGACGCNDSQPPLKPSSRPSRAVKGEATPIACARCNRCQARSQVSYIGTPFESSRDKQGLVKLCGCVAHWLEGTSNTRASQEMKMWKGTLSEIWKRCRVAVIWYEQNKAKLTDSQCIIDITWGPHRRVAQAGAPSRPRVLESKPFQVALAYRMDGDKRQFIPGSLSVQAVVSKKATYNGRVALTMMEPSCQIACDCGGEWARLPSLFADVKTVNHNLEWVAADGTCTNLGEAHNGILKSLGAKLGLWKGGVPDVELNDRWQEMAWRALSHIKY